jgi:hypothetical protein
VWIKDIEKPTPSTIAARSWMARRTFLGRDRRRADAGYQMSPPRSCGRWPEAT